MPNDARPEREWWTVQLAEGDSSKPEFRTDLKALEHVDSLRRLADPSFKPTALIRHRTFVRHEVEELPLADSSDDEVAEKVRLKLIEYAKTAPVPQGLEGLQWTVRATREVLDGE